MSRVRTARSRVSEVTGWKPGTRTVHRHSPWWSQRCTSAPTSAHHALGFLAGEAGGAGRGALRRWPGLPHHALMLQSGEGHQQYRSQARRRRFWLRR